MAQHPMPQFDPLSAPVASEAQSPPNSARSDQPELSIANLTSTMFGEGTGDLSADVALDLVLTDVVEQARLATGATAAAVALKRADEIVCRAATGPNAPDLGVRLDQYSGLSGACVQSKTSQRCDDSETDARVDAAFCRRLGIRSILVSPILRQEELLGVIEVFSPKPHAFSDREVQTVQALSRIIIHNMEHLARATEPSAPLPETVAETVEETLEVEIKRADVSVPLAASSSMPARSDPWTTVLVVLVIGVALALGWLVGHVEQRRSKTASVKPVLSRSQVAAPPSAVTLSAGAKSGDEKVSSATTPVPPPAAPSPATGARQSGPGASNPKASPSDLTIYRDGKLIYRQPPKSAPSEPATSHTSSVVFLSPEVANQLLLQRVEPEYPEAARSRHIQGPVTLQLTVGKDGVVQTMSALSGDDRLANAAMDAARQWRFKPFIQQGAPVEFQTDVTVEFHLP
jgi:TonB family protein